MSDMNCRLDFLKFDSGGVVHALEKLVNEGVVMRNLIVAIMFWSLAIHSAMAEDPHQKFPTSKNHTKKTVVTWTSVNNVQAECERQSHRRGYGGFNYPVEACSFWNKDTCEIVTAKVVNFHTVGHEIRHCFQGDFH